jgi:hypothetical protein
MPRPNPALLPSPALFDGTTVAKASLAYPPPTPSGRPARRSAGRTQDAHQRSWMTAGSERIPCNYRSGRYWARTSDLRLVETALSQLS